MSTISKVAFALAALGVSTGVASADKFGFGTTPGEAELKAAIFAWPADGRDLPPGKGTYEEGKTVYTEKCAACHGMKLEGVPTAGIGGDKLIGGRGSLVGGKPVKTIESYWPYATTVFDYVKRAMPFNAPGSLTDSEVYAVTAYILGEANIVGKGEVIDAQSLAKVKMPNRDGFIPDPRPDVKNY
jgi:S-disulfanyl-L-cysteine oxidoreductase SoxD